MQTDLFINPSQHEIEYATALAKQVSQEEQFRIDNGIIANWIEGDFLLDKAERRLLELIADNAGYVLCDNDWHVVQYRDEGQRRVSGLTIALGMNAEANSKAVVNAAKERGLIVETRDNVSRGNRLDLTHKGRHYLDLCEHTHSWDYMEY